MRAVVLNGERDVSVEEVPDAEGYRIFDAREDGVLKVLLDPAN